MSRTNGPHRGLLLVLTPGFVFVSGCFSEELEKFNMELASK